MTLLWIVLFLILIFILFLVIRTMRFKPRKEEAVFDPGRGRGHEVEVVQGRAVDRKSVV